MKFAAEKQYEPLNLSPLAPLGSCSSLGLVDQNNIVSALRGTEVVADATNLLALIIADRVMHSSDKDLVLRYAATHRHVRAQYFTNPDFSAHFSAFCLASGGFDKGNYIFEISQLREHIGILYGLLERKYLQENLIIRFYLKRESEQFLSIMKKDKDPFWDDKRIEYGRDPDNGYYDTVQFKIFLKKNNREIDLADGGLVDWTQKLIQNKKHRLMISGIGLELFVKL